MVKDLNQLPLRSGVGIIILNKYNKVFVAKRIDNPKNFWQMPQGGVEDGEESNDFRIKTETDNQLKYAIKLLNG